MTQTTDAPVQAPPKRKRKWLRRCAYVLLTVFVSLNVIAYMQARAMTHFVDSGVKTLQPRELSSWQKFKLLFTGVTVPKPVNRAQPPFPFTTHTFKTPDGETLEAWHIPVETTTTPRGTVAIFHGYTACKSTMLFQAKLFRSLGFDVFMVDFRAAGGSTGNICTISYMESQDVATSVEYARKSNLIRGPLVVYGDSMGAAAIMRAMAQHGVTSDAAIIEQPFSTLYTTTTHRFQSMEIPSFPLSGMLVFWGGVQNGFWAFQLKPADDAPSIRCPTLYIRGENDPWISMAESQSVFDAISGTKTLLTIRTNRHDALWPRDKQKWVEGVSLFLDSVAAKREQR